MYFSSPDLDQIVKVSIGCAPEGQDLDALFYFGISEHTIGEGSNVDHSSRLYRQRLSPVQRSCGFAEHCHVQTEELKGVFGRQQGAFVGTLNIFHGLHTICFIHHILVLWE